MKRFFPFFENFNRDFGTLGMGIVQIGLQIRTRRPRIRLYAYFGKLGCIISFKNNQLACFFFCNPVHEKCIKAIGDFYESAYTSLNEAKKSPVLMG